MTRIVIASYNIHRGVGLDRRRDHDRIAEVIAEVAPDAIGLQEVVREDGDNHRDQAAYLASKLGMQLVMGETRTLLAGGSYGNAVLTRLPVLGETNVMRSRCQWLCGRAPHSSRSTDWCSSSGKRCGPAAGR